jgi:MSHA biogenesis protein MshE
MKQPVIREILARSGIVEATALERALEIQTRDGGSLGRILADLGSSTEDAVAHAIASGLGLDYVNLDAAELPAESDLCLPPEFCRERRVLPLGVQDRAVRLAMADPLDLATLQDVEFRSSKRTVAVVVAESAIVRMLKRLYPELEQTGPPADAAPASAPEGELEGSVDADYEVVDPAELAKGVELPPVVRLVNLILTDAAKAGASDIHMEPQETSMQVRQRVDGMLRDMPVEPKRLAARVKAILGRARSRRAASA